MLANDAASEAALVASINQYNSLLASHLAAFKESNRGVTGWIVDTAAPFNKAIADPKAYGAPNATCYNSDGTSCLWYNDYHPGIAINNLVAEAVAKTVGKPWFNA
jgi:phospholipase/lecithinase/hemolysin